ncbi:stigma-specific STIG1-like protein 3 [Zingiber officinale]|uniref:Stigma-specific Stig1 family protein n=1 Tax=Zingiber officinale TaxID=94328 RepID=A0A8J5F6E8_ZINOF|nr:stigma-specific STIG1-like protein 3 [Zingiber officinale]KAG6479798.1 hypothetical protein ZIOFF_063272 [Zingiber officinale]
MRKADAADAALFLVAALLLALWAAAAGEIGGGSGRQSRFLPENGGRRCTINRGICQRQRMRCCGDECVDTSSDEFNCGRCGHECDYAYRCCGGKCVALQFDTKNCGICFRRCHNCTYGFCNYAS